SGLDPRLVAPCPGAAPAPRLPDAALFRPMGPDICGAADRFPCRDTWGGCRGKAPWRRERGRFAHACERGGGGGGPHRKLSPRDRRQTLLWRRPKGDRAIARHGRPYATAALREGPSWFGACLPWNLRPARCQGVGA